MDAQRIEKGVVTASYLETWLFKHHRHFVIVDPAQGTLFRALGENCNVYVLMTTKEEKWEEQLYETFAEEFAAKKLQFEVVTKQEALALPDVICYHGMNGFKSQMLLPISIALEPNAYSQDLRKSGLGLEAKGDNWYLMTYKRKERMVQYMFPKYSGHYRVDPMTLKLTMNLEGDSFFLATTFDPERLKVLNPSSQPCVVGDIMAYDIMPPYVKDPLLGQMISEDAKYVYDVQGVATCMSRREYTSSVATEKNKQIAPLSLTGHYIASPYSTKFVKMGMTQYGEVTVVESPAMSAKAITAPEHLSEFGKRPSQFKAVAFVLGYKEGAKLCPFEKFGTTCDVKTYVSANGQVRYSDIRPLLGKKSIVFSSFEVMREHLYFMAYWVLGDVAPFISSEMPALPKYDFQSVRIQDDGEEVDRPAMSTAGFSKDFRQRLVEWFESDTRYKTTQDIQKAYPEHSISEIEKTMLYHPEFSPTVIFTGEEDEVVWTFKENKKFPTHNEDGGGLSAYDTALFLKSAFMGGEHSFCDDEDEDVTPQHEYLLLLGAELYSTVTMSGLIERRYRILTDF